MSQCKNGGVLYLPHRLALVRAQLVFD
jgi:hypothetical protein